ncbi:MAG TPA: hypothetical protein VGG97_20315 [Bryobacteraceae bacterium]|jgi:hypothetical protein
MFFNRTKVQAVYASAAFSLLGLLAQPAMARNHTPKPDYQVMGQVALNNGKTTDLFLRKNQEGRTFLYVASVNKTLTIFDVTNSREPRQVNRLALSGKSNSFTIRPVSDRLAVATTANDPADEFTLIELDHAPAVEIAKRLKNVDAYTIDGVSNTAYVAQDGQLLVLRFGHPITRDAEIWEQFFETR